MRNDEVDMKAHHGFEAPTLLQYQPANNRRVLSATDSPTYVVKKLVEPYPQGKCYNNGKLVNQT